MKKHLLTIAFALTTGFLQAQIVNIPDANFKAALLAHKPTIIDLNNDKEIQVSEAKVVTLMNVPSKSIKNLTGIEAFTALTSLYCDRNQLSTLDLSMNTALTFLYCPENGLTTMFVSKNTALTYLGCFSNKLSTLDVSKNTFLTELYCYSNELSTLDVSKNINLQTLSCSSNKLSTLDVSKNTSMTILGVSFNQLTTLDVSKNTALTRLLCTFNQLHSLDVSMNIAMTGLECTNNPLTTICINPTQITTNWKKDSAAQYTTTCSIITSVEEDTYTPTTKQLHRIFTPLGQEIKPEQANEGVFIYQYTDGSTRKIMKLE